MLCCVVLWTCCVCVVLCHPAAVWCCAVSPAAAPNTTQHRRSASQAIKSSKDGGKAVVLALIKEAGVSGSSATDLSAAVGEKAGKLDSAVEDARDVLDGASKCINLEPGGVTICNSIALIHPARTERLQHLRRGGGHPDDLVAVAAGGPGHLGGGGLEKRPAAVPPPRPAHRQDLPVLHVAEGRSCSRPSNASPSSRVE